MIKISKIFGDFVLRDPAFARARHFENRRGEGPGDEVALSNPNLHHKNEVCHVLRNLSPRG